MRHLLVLASPLLIALAAQGAKSPKIEVVGSGVIQRTSPTGGPPWSTVNITKIFGFKKAPRVGAQVLVVPAHGLPPVTLSIVRTEKRTEMGKSYWAVAVEEVKDEAYLQAPPQPGRRPELPDDVMVLYPAVKEAQAVAASGLGADDLPPKVTPDLVKSAVDLNGDGKPEALVVEMCCFSRLKPVGCDMMCGEKWVKTGKAWKLVDTSTPM